MLPSLNLVIAHRAEAKPFIELLALKQSVSKPFSIYKSRDGNVQLVLTGTGVVNAAAAVAHIQQSGARFINIGIAGHRMHDIGTCFSISKISSTLTSRQFFPKFDAKQFAHESLKTVIEPCADYPELSLYDMEGAAFYQTASLYTTHDNIQLFKLVSDNAENGIHKVNPHFVVSLISQHAELLIEYMLTLQDMNVAEELKPYQKLLSDLTSRIHFTVYQQHRLSELLRRFEVLGDLNYVQKHMGSWGQSSEVLQHLETMLNNTERYYGWESHV